MTTTTTAASITTTTTTISNSHNPKDHNNNNNNNNSSCSKTRNESTTNQVQRNPTKSSYPKSVLQNNIGALMLIQDMNSLPMQQEERRRESNHDSMNSIFHDHSKFHRLDDSILQEAAQRFYASLILLQQEEEEEEEEQELDPQEQIPINLGTEQDLHPDDYDTMSSNANNIATNVNMSSIPISMELLLPDISKIHVDIPGLTWFHNRLYKQVFSTTTTTTTTTTRNQDHPTVPPLPTASMVGMMGNGHHLFHSTPSIYNNTHPHLHLHHHHHYYPMLPLGIEYFLHPIMIQNQKDVQMAAGINLALCFFLMHCKFYAGNHHSFHTSTTTSTRRQKSNESIHDNDNTTTSDMKNSNTCNGPKSYLSTMLKIYQWILDLDRNIPLPPTSNTTTSNRHEQRHPQQQENPPPPTVDPILLAIAHNNLGVLRFLQQRNPSALQNFFQARHLFLQCSSIQQQQQQEEEMKNEMNKEIKDPERRTSLDNTTSSSIRISHESIPMSYLEITIALNCCRTAIHMKNASSVPLVTSLLEQILPKCSLALSTHTPSSTTSTTTTKRMTPKSQHVYKMMQKRIKWLISTCTYYIPGLLHQLQEHHHASLEKFNQMLSVTRKEWGHDHVYVATILERKGMVSFEERRYHSAMLSYFASLKILERAGENDDDTMVWFSCSELDQSRLWYAIGRTLHDREEFLDALDMYRKALNVRSHVLDTRLRYGDDDDDVLESMEWRKSVYVETIQIWTNICRIYHILGNLMEAMTANERIVDLAVEMMRDVTDHHRPKRTDRTFSQNDENDNRKENIIPLLVERHAFVRNRMMVLGNLYVEMGRLEDAMAVFTRIARWNMMDGDGHIHMWTSHSRPEVEDVDTNAFAIRAAERLGSIVRLPPHAAAA